MKKILFLLILALLSSCSEPTERIEKKLLPYLQEDLKFMVAEALNANTKKEDLLEEPYYKIRDFRLFEGAEAEIYAAYAEVDFYLYRNMAIYAKRLWVTTRSLLPTHLKSGPSAPRTRWVCSS